MQRKSLVFFTFLSVIVLLVSVTSCQDKANFTDPDALDALIQMEGIDPKNQAEVEKLKNEIIAARKDITTLVSTQGRLANFWNALGEQYRKNGMFQPALLAFQESLAIKANNVPVLYRAGLMAGQLYTLEADATKAKEWLSVAESYYRAAIEFGDDHPDSLYALAVIELFEKQQVGEAKALTRRFLVKKPDDSRGLFLMGRIAVEEGNPDKAIEYYDRILQSNASDEEKNQANANLEAIQNR